MKFWYGSRSESGSSDPYLWLMDPDPDPAIFVSDLQNFSKNLFIFPSFFLITFWRYIYIIFQRLKFINKSHNSRNQCFLTICAWWYKDPDPSGSATLVLLICFKFFSLSSRSSSSAVARSPAPCWTRSTGFFSWRSLTGGPPAMPSSYSGHH